MRLTDRTSDALPEDFGQAALVGRIWDPQAGGPCIVVLRDGELADITAAAPTMRDLCEAESPARLARSAEGRSLGSLEAVLQNTPRETRNAQKPWLLAPVDLQAIKAAGVTFVVSMLERVIEEQARGEASRANEIRAEIQSTIGDDLRKLKPGSEQAKALKALLQKKGVWSQYLEVGIGPDAEVFTKAQSMSAVGHLAEAGLHPMSSWNNPEPEVVLVVSSAGRIVGATLGNDVNLRDVEGRSALLLGKAKDNNASAAIGPLIRLFDEKFSLDDVRKAELRLTVEGDDGFRLEGASDMGKISRDPEEIVRQTIGANHQYPDGLVLYLGTMFAPTKDRGAPGQGFTHKIGDVVSVESPLLGKLVNVMVSTKDAEPWTFGTAALMRNLAKRGLI
jgi:fumarylacetoacetate (FAA) hydrolase family protein